VKIDETARVLANITGSERDNADQGTADAFPLTFHARKPDIYP